MGRRNGGCDIVAAVDSTAAAATARAVWHKDGENRRQNDKSGQGSRKRSNSAESVIREVR